MEKGRKGRRGFGMLGSVLGIRGLGFRVFCMLSSGLGIRGLWPCA